MPTEVTLGILTSVPYLSTISLFGLFLIFTIIMESFLVSVFENNISLASFAVLFNPPIAHL